jgi:hypothetical protein
MNKSPNDFAIKFGSSHKYPAKFSNIALISGFGSASYSVASSIDDSQIIQFWYARL